ncbi:S9 family peptidase [Mucilaginibacter sp. BJC16-A38]|uniref:S9 family peptidase n=1 Tax=Mucilaginibacter phenanthrenivorans TaxID=1234842 RepID=UPI002158382F|nr:S9 family peptidase [Mucilaginibacter phenanthrenivorans]MCR8559470.1 S9 family peptidase [Mucilaginibacter phenanthrenivorans]
MKKYLFLVFAGIYFSANAQTLIAPKTKKVPKVFTEYGNTRTDDYYWLNNPKDTAVIPHLEEENAYTAAYLKPTEGLQKKIYDELVARIEQKFQSLAVQENGYWYYVRYEAGSQYPLHCRKKLTQTAPEEVYLDENAEAKGHKIYLVRGTAISKDGKWLALGADTTGSRRSALHIKNLSDGTFLPEVIGNTDGSYAWAADLKTIYYTLNDATVRSYKVMKHTAGTDPATDKEIYTEKDSTFAVDVRTSDDNRFVFINTTSKNSNEVRYIDSQNPAAGTVLIQPRLKDVLYSAQYHGGDIFYIGTNYKAENFKLVTAPIAHPGVENWKDIIPTMPDAFLTNTIILKKYFVCQYQQKALVQIRVINRENGSSYYVDFKENAYMAAMSSSTDNYNSDSIRYAYTSLTTPTTQFKYNLATKEKILLKQAHVGGGYQAELYETDRIWVKARDGVMVPVSVVYKKSLFKKDGSNPMLLYAYGSYGANSDPFFNGAVISLLDRGFVYAIAHIRGGQEMGRYWYKEQGRLFHKKNTFTDCVDCAQYLVDNKYSLPDKLFANGVSAGGMLMGAIINLRPDLFRGVLAEVPWMDVVSDMLDTSLPLTTLEYEEWGDPNQKDYYDYMLSWSPYDNVKKAKYPAIFATGGLNDTQVPYFSPAKWVAKVRENNTGTDPVLFKVNMGAGHGGDSGRFDRQKLTALKYAFMLSLLGRDQ